LKHIILKRIACVVDLRKSKSWFKSFLKMNNSHHCCHHWSHYFSLSFLSIVCQLKSFWSIIKKIRHQWKPILHAKKHPRKSLSYCFSTFLSGTCLRLFYTRKIVELTVQNLSCKKCANLNRKKGLSFKCLTNALFRSQLHTLFATFLTKVLDVFSMLKGIKYKWLPKK
jgi:hypothetical protein